LGADQPTDAHGVAAAYQKLDRRTGVSA
jgi:hypothetical protein